MKALTRYCDHGEFGGYHYIDVPAPECGPDDVIIRLKAAAICGADMKHWYADLEGSNTSEKLNSIRGHEFAGVIVKVGENVTDWKVGQRVVSDNSGQACGKCPACGGRLLKRTSRNGYAYYACERGKDCPWRGTGMDGREIIGFMTWDVPTAEVCPECGKTLFKRSGRGRSKPFCINPECVNYLPPEQRGYKIRKSEDKDAGEGGESKDGAAAARKPAARKTAAKKPAAKKPAAKKAAVKKSTAKKPAAKKPAAKKPASGEDA